MKFLRTLKSSQFFNALRGSVQNLIAGVAVVVSTLVAQGTAFAAEAPETPTATAVAGDDAPIQKAFNDIGNIGLTDFVAPQATSVPAPADANPSSDGSATPPVAKDDAVPPAQAQPEQTVPANATATVPADAQPSTVTSDTPTVPAPTASPSQADAPPQNITAPMTVVVPPACRGDAIKFVASANTTISKSPGVVGSFEQSNDTFAYCVLKDSTKAQLDQALPLNGANVPYVYILGAQHRTRTQALTIKDGAVVFDPNAAVQVADLSAAKVTEYLDGSKIDRALVISASGISGFKMAAPADVASLSQQVKQIIASAQPGAPAVQMAAAAPPPSINPADIPTLTEVVAEAPAVVPPVVTKVAAAAKSPAKKAHAQRVAVQHRQHHDTQVAVAQATPQHKALPPSVVLTKAKQVDTVLAGLHLNSAPSATDLPWYSKKPSVVLVPPSDVMVAETAPQHSKPSVLNLLRPLTAALAALIFIASVPRRETVRKEPVAADFPVLTEVLDHPLAIQNNQPILVGGVEVHPAQAGSSLPLVERVDLTKGFVGDDSAMGPQIGTQTSGVATGALRLAASHGHLIEPEQSITAMFKATKKMVCEYRCGAVDAGTLRSTLDNLANKAKNEFANGDAETAFKALRYAFNIQAKDLKAGRNYDILVALAENIDAIHDATPVGKNDLGLVAANFVRNKTRSQQSKTLLDAARRNYKPASNMALGALVA